MVGVDEKGPVAPVSATQLPDKQEQQEQKRPQEDDREDRGTSSWQQNITDVAFIMGIPEAELTPRIHEALTIIMGEFDNIRNELERAKEHVAYLEGLSDRHHFLPVQNRRALLRELARVLTRAEKSGTNSSFLCLDIVNAADIKRRHGRRAAEGALEHAASLLGDTVRASDVVGCLGGSDFGVILSVTEGSAAGEKSGELVATLEGEPFKWQDETIRLRLAWGLHSFERGDTAEAVLDAADRARRADAAATRGDPLGETSGK